MAVQSGSTPAAANPYAAPQAAVHDQVEGFELAGRGERLGAAIIDGLCFGVIGIGAAISVPAFRGQGGEPSGVAIAVIALAFLALVVINLYLLYTSAATIGKRALKIRIARTDGTQPGLARLIFLRGLPVWLVSAIPYVGNLFSLVDVLFIFGEARRCVHDRIADTIVIKAPAAA